MYKMYKMFLSRCLKMFWTGNEEIFKPLSTISRQVKSTYSERSDRRSLVLIAEVNFPVHDFVGRGGHAICSGSSRVRSQTNHDERDSTVNSVLRAYV